VLNQEPRGPAWSSAPPAYDRDADFLNGQIAALWRTIAELQGSLAKLHAERIRTISGNEIVDAKKLN
jgi:hypothetical protein